MRDWLLFCGVLFLLVIAGLLANIAASLECICRGLS